MKKFAVMALLFAVGAVSAQFPPPPPAPPPPPLEEFNGDPDVSFYYKNPGVNNVIECECVAFAHGLQPGKTYYVFILAIPDVVRDIQPGDWLRKGDGIIADAQGKALFVDKWDTFAHQMPQADAFYHYKIYLVLDDGTPNGKWVDHYGWDDKYIENQ
jgi:hypothetical protein